MTAALLLDALLAGTGTDGNLPGPLGLPGGYPVRLRGRELELRLPPGFDRAAAVAWNQRMADRDGVRVEGDRVRLNPGSAEVLAPYLGRPPRLRRQLRGPGHPAVATVLLDLRTRLRAAARQARPEPEDRSTGTPQDPGVSVTATANLVLDYYEQLPAVIARCRTTLGR